MVGLPAYQNLYTKDDFEYCRNNFTPDQYLPLFQILMDDLMKWMMTGQLNDPSQGITDDTHRVVNQGDNESPDCWQQQVYAQDPNCRLFRLGFTVEEVQQALSGN
jgi:hypothetical protein